MKPIRRLSKKLKDAIKSYYQHRKENNLWYNPDTRAEAPSRSIDQNRKGIPPWDKQEDLKRIQDAAFSQSPKIVHFIACAGTFWFTWKTGNIITQHNEKNWSRMKIWKPGKR